MNEVNKNINPEENIEEASTPEANLFKAKKYFFRFFKDVIDLDRGVDKRATINEIKNKKSMSGANAWMLMCSICLLYTSDAADD